MPLDPILKPLLADSPPLPTVIDDFDAFRAEENAGADAAADTLMEPAPAGAHRSVHSIPVEEGVIDVHVFTPETAGPHPAHLYLHGGGWIGGSIKQKGIDILCTERAVFADCVVVTVEYRKAPEHQFPVGLNDCYAALLWLVDNAARLRIRRELITIGGGSAGANLAAAVTLRARDENGPPLSLQILDVPALDLTMNAPSFDRNATGYGITTEYARAMADLYLKVPDDARHPYASPLLADDLSGLPPAYILPAEYDPLCDDGAAYAARLKAAGVPVTLSLQEGQYHGSSALTKILPAGRAWRDETIAALSAINQAGQSDSSRTLEQRGRQRRTRSEALDLKGYVETGFERVADAFVHNFTDRDDRGAACAVVIEGSLVVDLFAGSARGDATWTTATRTPVFSVSKGVTAICLLMAAEQGHLDLDEPVAAYWPEFGAHGKDRITVRHALAHRTGTVGFSQPWESEALAAWAPIVDDLASQVPMWEPDSAFAYHPVSVGFIAGELLRRTTGMRVSQWLAQYVTTPMGLDMAYGADANDPNYAPMLPPHNASGPQTRLSTDEFALMQQAMLEKSAYQPDIFTAAATSAFLGPESPAANLVTSARDLARLYGATVHPSKGTRLLSDDSIATAIQPLSSGRPFIGPDKGDVWGTGFMLHSARRGMAGPGSFGHDGAGGHLAFAQPALGLGFGYQSTQAGDDTDIRAEALSAALRECL